MAPITFNFKLLLGRAEGTPSHPTLSVEHLPPSVLEQIGVQQPPPGIKANFVDPESIGGVLLAFSIIGIVIMSICVAIRGWVIFKLIRPIKWAWSDTVFTVAVLAALAMFIDLILTVTGKGQIGIHQWNVQVSSIVLSSRFFKTAAVISLLTPICLGLIKITIFLTYIEIFSRLRWIKISCWVGIVITSIFYLIVMSCAIFWSFPHIGETFVEHYLKAVGAIKSQELSIPTASVGLTIDVYLFLIPALAVSGLKMQRKKKVAVMLIFTTGFLAIIASILSIIYRVNMNRHIDHTWNSVAVWALTAGELWIGLIIACTPHFTKFFRVCQKVFSRFGSVIRYWLCCCCMSWKEMDSRRSAARSSKKFEETSAKSSDKSEGSHFSEPEKPKKHVNLYPNLDITTVNRTLIEQKDW
ncbi:e7e449d0-169c-45ab-8012-9beda1504f11 [Sclerotinia trifoliorum]|uniref:E7e449d0-169c-45ab-8012-9beda1504f11 n=1 Tax=Sclerotinia trifoliorum TaxID=28548 RepID=A0A8H2VY76_9HELO|nr:e7e449d0-169c-45ab-8012-9beda1504f11 [Sclerotinia trifoliorum]